ncbi:MAG: prepilin-type N-terminal cleavage/methylation domain-containing protein [Propionibacteriales bacterium]|nr:prepilin-type N-terminal cleavage/methylation domain-containing protein [Propionibacteriales bacterium]
MHLRRNRSAAQADDGFTLIELLVTVIIMGTIAAALAGVVISYLKHTVNSQSRMTESLELQFVTAYWQRDVSSIGVRGTTYNDADLAFPLVRSVNVAPCAAAASLNQVVTLAWNQYINPELEVDDPAGLVQVKVTYGTRGSSGDLELVRVRCGTEPAEVVVAEHLTAVAVTCTGGGVSGCNDNTGAVPTRITMTLSVRDPEGQGNTDIVNQTIEGERRQT